MYIYMNKPSIEPKYKAMGFIFAELHSIAGAGVWSRPGNFSHVYAITATSATTMPAALFNASGAPNRMTPEKGEWAPLTWQTQRCHIIINQNVATKRMGMSIIRPKYEDMTKKGCH